MKGSVRVLVHLRVPPGEEARVEELYHQVSRALDGTPGLVGNELLRGLHAPGEWAVMSEWRSTAAFRQWEDGPDHRADTAPLRPYQNRGLVSVFGAYEVRAEYTGRRQGRREQVRRDRT